MKMKLLAALVACMGLLVVHMGRAQPIPAHMLGNPVAFQTDILAVETAASLRQSMKEFGNFPTNLNDLKFYQTKHEHIGEARPIGPDGACDHPFLVPSSNRSLCVLPGRIDIGRHFIRTGVLRTPVAPVHQDQGAGAWVCRWAARSARELWRDGEQSAILWPVHVQPG